ncbi:MAG: M23 family metallopeptidase [Alphaproteobacteria bacterium]|nr:M23 family metallopeptidase [Alphaproteobacteria bacterium]
MASFRKAAFALLAILASPLVAGCMPSSPETVFNWDVNDRAPRVAYHRPVQQATRTASAARTGARTYVYREALTPIPTPRPNPVVRQASLQPIPRPAATPDTYPPSTVAFAWPVTGPVIEDFGSTASGARNDGINIATAMDAPIRASASGTITYAGDELKGYGNLVLIKHSGGYTTAYAHADRLVVQRGDFVAKGQVIGYAGQTGDVTRPQLHFEIRSNTTPVNPRAYLMTTQARS